MTIDTAASISSNCTNYKVNPKLIICMLQKESSLVTKTKDSANYDSCLAVSPSIYFNWFVPFNTKTFVLKLDAV